MSRATYTPDVAHGMHELRAAGWIYREIGDLYGVSDEVTRLWVGRYRRECYGRSS